MYSSKSKTANTNPEQNREVTLKFIFEPSATREVGEIWFAIR